MKTAVFTLATHQTYAQAQALMASLAVHNPEVARFVVLTDNTDCPGVAGAEGFSPLFGRDLGLAGSESLFFAISDENRISFLFPFILRKFLGEEYESVLYIAPDACIYQPLDAVASALNDGAELVLLPGSHVGSFGSFDPAFFALKRSENISEVLKDACEKQLKAEKNFFAATLQEQILLLLGARLNDRRQYIQDDGYGVSHRNLKGREISRKGDDFYIDGKKLVLFQFEAVPLDDINQVSLNQHDLTLNELGATAWELFHEYVDRLMHYDPEKCADLSSPLDQFSDGRKICAMFRIAYRKVPKVKKACNGNPYDSADVFYKDYKSDIIACYLQELWNTRPDLRERFGLPTKYYYLWFLKNAYKELDFDRQYVEDFCLGISHMGIRAWLESMFIAEQVLFFDESNVKSVLKRMLRFALPQNLYAKLKNMRDARRGKPGKTLCELAAPQPEPNKVELLSLRTFSAGEEFTFPADLQPGVNLIGYMRSELGLGESCRYIAEALTARDMAWNACDFEAGNPSRQLEHRWDDKITDDIRYNMSIIHIGPDQLPGNRQFVPERVWDTYKIGVWYWELSDFPDEWLPAFELVDEVWVATRFIADSVSLKADRPVLTMPIPIKLEDPAGIGREHFSLPENTFLILTMFATFSYQDRKNPEASIRAFRKAFAKDDMSVGLVIKINNAWKNQKDIERLEELKGDYQNIYFIRKTLSRLEVNALIKCCDASISLHRSEGLGLLCMESMYFGKPVVATNYSGNVDFMNNDCACMVDYKLIPVGHDCGPYKAYQHWADADADQAADYLLRLRNDRSYYERISRNAKHRIHTEYSPEACGERMRQRLNFLERRYAARPAAVSESKN